MVAYFDTVCLLCCSIISTFVFPALQPGDFLKLPKLHVKPVAAPNIAGNLQELQPAVDMTLHSSHSFQVLKAEDCPNLVDTLGAVRVPK